jgi:hypothetical protein
MGGAVASKEQWERHRSAALGAFEWPPPPASGEDCAAAFAELAARLDPWAELGVAEQVARVVAEYEELRECTVEGAQECADAAALLEAQLAEAERAAEAAKGDQAAEFAEAEQAAGGHAARAACVLALCVGAGEAFPRLGGSAAAQRVVALKLDGSSSAAAAAPRLVGAPWLRLLSLVSVEAPALDLWGLSRLVVLDVSAVQTDDNALLDLSAVPALRRLTADSVGWDRLPAGLCALAHLESLSAQDNAMEDPEASYEVLAQLHALRELDLRENPFFMEIGQVALRRYRERVRQLLPELVTLDNQQLKLGGAATMSLAKVQGLREHMGRTDTVADQNEDHESCSCLEGTPCEQEYSCKDWKHRFEIAKYAREHHGKEARAGVATSASKPGVSPLPAALAKPVSAAAHMTVARDGAREDAHAGAGAGAPASPAKAAAAATAAQAKRSPTGAGAPPKEPTPSAVSPSLVGAGTGAARAATNTKAAGTGAAAPAKASPFGAASPSGAASPTKAVAAANTSAATSRASAASPSNAVASGASSLDAGSNRAGTTATSR